MKPGCIQLLLKDIAIFLVIFTIFLDIKLLLSVFFKNEIIFVEHPKRWQ